MRFFLTCFLYLFLVSCSVEAKDDLKQYREKALKSMVHAKIEKDIHSVKFKKKRSFGGKFMTLFQTDNVDRSTASFIIQDENEKTRCGLYIRETTPDEVVVNLIDCTGVYADQLSGLGSDLLTTFNKQDLK